MDIFTQSVLACLEEVELPFQNHNVFTCYDVCFHVIEGRERLSGLPLDAKQFRILLERPIDDGVDPWKCEVVLAVRSNKIFNPKSHMRIVDYWADDISDRNVVEARMVDWAMGR